MKLKCDEPLSNFAFNFNLRRYSKALPKVCIEDPNNKGGGKNCKSRKTVGVRLSADPVCAALLVGLNPNPKPQTLNLKPSPPTPCVPPCC